MIIAPKVRGFICTTAHPVGCAKNVDNQIQYVLSQRALPHGPKKVLVIGASTGFGLASRIVAAYAGGHAATIGVIYEKESDGRKTASAGWYNTAGFEKRAQEDGIYAKSFNGDAFSDDMKKRVVRAIRQDWGSVDLLIYSLASPRRLHPKTGEVSQSVLKPIGRSYGGKSLDVINNKLVHVELPEATQDDIDQTVNVMGGEDWTMWVDALMEENLLAEGFMSVAYSYVGPKMTKAIYRNGTIGKAKDHLERTANELTERLKKVNGRALISVNKALVTQSSSAIPFIPLYFVLLKKIMKEKNVEENCIQQIYRLFSERLYRNGEIPTDENGFVRIDDYELSPEVQSIVEKNWDMLTEENLEKMADLEGYHQDFLNLFGFDIPGVDYKKDVDPNQPIPSIKPE